MKLRQRDGKPRKKKEVKKKTKKNTSALEDEVMGTTVKNPDDSFRPTNSTAFPGHRHLICLPTGHRRPL